MIAHVFASTRVLPCQTCGTDTHHERIGCTNEFMCGCGTVQEVRPEPLDAQAAEVDEWNVKVLDVAHQPPADACGNLTPTKDDRIAEFILSLDSDEREYAASIIDGVSSREWWDAQQPIEY